MRLELELEKCERTSERVYAALMHSEITARCTGGSRIPLTMKYENFPFSLQSSVLHCVSNQSEECARKMCRMLEPPPPPCSRIEICNRFKIKNSTGDIRQTIFLSLQSMDLLEINGFGPYQSHAYAVMFVIGSASNRRTAFTSETMTAREYYFNFAAIMSFIFFCFHATHTTTETRIKLICIQRSNAVCVCVCGV